MDLRCYLHDKSLSSLSEANKHLKKIHFAKENVDEICCLVDSKMHAHKCTNTYKKFNSMIAHVKKCLERKMENAVEQVWIIIHCK